MRIAPVFIALLVFAALSAHADGTYFRSVMPDGRVIFGDAPAPGAKDVRKVPLPSANQNTMPPVQSPANASGGDPNEGAPLHERQQALTAAEANLQAAKKALDDAQAELAAQQEPLPGERIGTTSGFTRLTDGYFGRIKAYEDAVDTAQTAYDEALKARDAARY